MSENKKKFPDYFKNFELPKVAGENNFKVYRACKTHKADKESFTPSFEEENCEYNIGDDKSDPGLYSLSVFENPKDVRRFAKFRPKINYPVCKIAVGFTNPECGLSARTSDYKPNKSKKQRRSSHVDWWLYENAEPYKYFSIIDNIDSYIEEYESKQKGGENNGEQSDV